MEDSSVADKLNRNNFCLELDNTLRLSQVSFNTFRLLQEKIFDGEIKRTKSFSKFLHLISKIVVIDYHLD